MPIKSACHLQTAGPGAEAAGQWAPALLRSTPAAHAPANDTDGYCIQAHGSFKHNYGRWACSSEHACKWSCPHGTESHADGSHSSHTSGSKHISLGHRHIDTVSHWHADSLTPSLTQFYFAFPHSCDHIPIAHSNTLEYRGSLGCEHKLHACCQMV